MIPGKTNFTPAFKADSIPFLCKYPRHENSPSIPYVQTTFPSLAGFHYAGVRVEIKEIP